MSDGFFSIFNVLNSFTNTQKPDEGRGPTLSTLEDDYDISLIRYPGKRNILEQLDLQPIENIKQSKNEIIEKISVIPDRKIKAILLQAYLKHQEAKVTQQQIIDDFSKIDNKKFAVREIDEETTAIVDMKAHIEAIRQKPELRSRALNEFRIICSRFLSHLSKLDQAYIKKNKAMQDKKKFINEEVNRRLKQRNIYKEKHLGLLKDLSDLTSYMSRYNHRATVVQNLKNNNKSSEYIDKLIMANKFRKDCEISKNEKIQKEIEKTKGQVNGKMLVGINDIGKRKNSQQVSEIFKHNQKFLASSNAKKRPMRQDSDSNSSSAKSVNIIDRKSNDLSEEGDTFRKVRSIEIQSRSNINYNKASTNSNIQSPNAPIKNHLLYKNVQHAKTGKLHNRNQSYCDSNSNVDFSHMRQKSLNTSAKNLHSMSSSKKEPKKEESTGGFMSGQKSLSKMLWQLPKQQQFHRYDSLMCHQDRQSKIFGFRKSSKMQQTQEKNYEFIKKAYQQFQKIVSRQSKN